MTKNSSESAAIDVRSKEDPKTAMTHQHLKASSTRNLSVGQLSLAAKHYLIVVLLAILVVVAQIEYSGFLRWANISDILSQNSAIGIIAVGMTFVVISGGFDLSVGATYALGGTVYAGVTVSSGSWLVGLLAGVVVGFVVGAVNGVLVAWFRVNAFVATLGTSSVISGAAYIYSHSSPIIVSQNSDFHQLALATPAGVPLPIVIMVILMIIGSALLAKTSYGRNVYSIGGNQQAAKLSGLRVPWLTASTYTATGLLAAFAGMIDASRLGVGQANVGGSIALDTIAAVVIGGTSLRGGEGAVWRSAIGLLILATMTNLFLNLNVDSNWQLVAQGSIVIAAVALDTLVRRRNT